MRINFSTPTAGGTLTCKSTIQSNSYTSPKFLLLSLASPLFTLKGQNHKPQLEEEHKCEKRIHQEFTVGLTLLCCCCNYVFTVFQFLVIWSPLGCRENQEGRKGKILVSFVFCGFFLYEVCFWFFLFSFLVRFWRKRGCYGFKHNMKVGCVWWQRKQRKRKEIWFCSCGLYCLVLVGRKTHLLRQVVLSGFIGWWSLFLGSHIIYFVFLHFSCNQIDIFECSVESEGLFSFHVYWFCLIHVWLRRNLQEEKRK